MRRPGSPLFGFSILTTSAPSQASASVQVGPASNWVRSTTRTPLQAVKRREISTHPCISSIRPVSPELACDGKIPQNALPRNPPISANSPALRGAEGNGMSGYSRPVLPHGCFVRRHAASVVRGERRRKSAAARRDAAMMAAQSDIEPAGRAMSDIKHFIDGKRAEGAERALGRRVQPGDRRARPPRRARRRRRGRCRRCSAARRGVPGLGRDAAAAPRPRHVQVPRTAARASTTRWPASITAEHGKVLSDAQGEVTRGIEVVEFACGIPHLLRASSPSRSAAASTAGRCASRSASAPASRRSTSRRWCRCGCSRWRSPAATPSS